MPLAHAHEREEVRLAHLPQLAVREVRRLLVIAERGECLEWMMARRLDISRAAPGAEVRPVSLARWMLGMD